jgi:hypothetical protein
MGTHVRGNIEPGSLKNRFGGAMSDCSRPEHLLIIGIAIFFFSCSNSTLSEYVPKSDEEKRIVEVLIRYETAKISFDIEGLLSCLHEEGEYSLACRNVVSKSELKESLPRFWERLRSNDPLLFPIVHECVNGDYFEGGELVNPEIRIVEDNASVALRYVNIVYSLRYYIGLKKENGHWLIDRLKWEDY